MTRRIGINENGRRCGETHHRAKLSNEDVETILFLRAGGLSYAEIVAKWDAGTTIGKTTVRDICTGRRRATWPVRWIER